MSALAVAPLTRRTLERRGMTPEQELELLINEQQADDTFYVDRPSGEISLDAPAPHGEGTIGDLLAYDEEGELLVMLPLPATPPLADANQHGTIYSYKRLSCRCLKCKAAQASFMREYRARKKS